MLPFIGTIIIVGIRIATHYYGSWYITATRYPSMHIGVDDGRTSSSEGVANTYTNA